MIIFRNPGLLDLAAATTLGVSVKAPGSFGWFGTGFKFALATILRGGGEVRMQVGPRRFHFEAVEEIIRGEPFKRIWLMEYEGTGGESVSQTALGFTDQLGRGWEPWMAYRELRCNALDEGGDVFNPSKGEDGPLGTAGPDWTYVEVIWDKLDEAHDQRAAYFAEGEPLWASDVLRVLPGPSVYLFYRGVRVHKLNKPSAFRYDLLKQQTLTEDRNLAETYTATALVRDAILTKVEDEGVLGGFVLAGGERWEGSVNLDSETITPSKAFVDVVLAAKDRGDASLSSSARAMLSRQLRREREGGGYSSYRGREDNFSEAIEALARLGLDLGPGGGSERDVILVDELPNDRRSLAEGGRIFILRSLLRASVRDIAHELALREVELRCYGLDDTAALLLPLLLDRERSTKVVKLVGEQPEGRAELLKADEVSVDVAYDELAEVPF